MYIDKKLTFGLHIENLYRQLLKYLHIFYNSRAKLNNSTKHLIYDTLIKPKLSYGIEIYGFSKKKHLERLQKLQNKLIKILFVYDRRTSSDLLYKNLNILNVGKLHLYFTYIMQWKILYDQNVHLSSDIKPIDTFAEAHRYNTRYKYNYMLKFNKYNYVTSIPFKMKQIWNEIPQSIKNSKSFMIFKNNIKVFIDKNTSAKT